jgi:hypothetical protein
MREKCARVLAAALMTGAIGFALAMPAFFGTAHDASRSLTAPPSFLQRSVHVVASAPSRSARAGRLEETHRIRPADFLSVVRSASTRNGSNRRSSTAGRSKIDPKPAPKPTTPAPAAPTPTPDTRGLATNTPPAAVAPAAPTQPAQSAGGNGKGRGKGHDKNKGKATETSQPAAPVATPQPANEPSATDGEKDHGHDNGKDKGRNDDKGHDG